MYNKMLKNSWSLYDHEKSNDKNYEKCTRFIKKISNVDEFWEMYMEYPKPSKLFYNKVNKLSYIYDGKPRCISSISFFKDNILPEWEDPSNKKGGELAIRDFLEYSSMIECLDKYWERLLVYYISDESLYKEYINGLRLVDSSVISQKKQFYRIELWFSDLLKKDDIENEFKKVLNLKNNEQIFFKSH